MVAPRQHSLQWFTLFCSCGRGLLYGTPAVADPRWGTTKAFGITREVTGVLPGFVILLRVDIDQAPTGLQNRDVPAVVVQGPRLSIDQLVNLLCEVEPPLTSNRLSDLAHRCMILGDAEDPKAARSGGLLFCIPLS